MASKYKNLAYSSAEYTHVYSGIRGVQLNGSETVSDTSRMAYCQNMYKDYEKDGADVIESIPGYRCLAKADEKAYGIHVQRTGKGADRILVHTGKSLKYFDVSDTDGDSTELTDTGAELQEERSCGIGYGNSFYILDGKSIFGIDADGVTKAVSADGASPYIPTTYVSGEKYEQRNLLSDKFKEEYRIYHPTMYSPETSGLKYTVIDAEAGYCSVSGADDDVSGDIFIPSYTDISGVTYKVVKIGIGAFAYNEKITSVYISEGVTEICTNAFDECKKLETAILPKSMERIGIQAFSECWALSTLYISDGFKEFGIACFAGCMSLKSMDYSLSEDDFANITNSDYTSAIAKTYNSRYTETKLSLPLHGNIKSVESVSYDGNPIDFTLSVDGSETSVLISFPDEASATGINVLINGTYEEYKSSFTGTDDSEALEKLTGFDAICGCTQATVFDGRIFFASNPKLPNTVFYTSSASQSRGSALYVEMYNYFNDGVGSYCVKAMLPVGDKLAVFKEGDDSGGSIYYHKRQDTSEDGISSVYPVVYVHSGICAVGSAHSFLDDPLFLTTEGVYALESENINYQRSVVCRSHNVNYDLLKESLSDASLATWLGYLVVGVNGKMYLADSRSIFVHHTGSKEYDWFCINGIGGYEGSDTVYKYSDEAYTSDTHSLSVKTDSIGTDVTCDVYSLDDGTGEYLYYTLEDGVYYSVVKTDQLKNGSFYPARMFAASGKKLFFITDAGHICVFNNDKRGVAPDIVKEASDFDEAEYSLRMGDKIHPYYYTFMQHAIVCKVKTGLDNCGIPHLTKNTVKRSLTVKAVTTSCESIKCEVITDSADANEIAVFPASDNDFGSFSFSTSPWYKSKYTTTVLPEKEKGWIEKQIILSTDAFRSLFSLSSVTYRYTIKGRIKNDG